MRKSDLFFNVIRLPVDFAMLIGSGLATYFFRTEIISVLRPVLFELNLPIIKYLYLVVFVSLLFIGAYAMSGLYSMKYRLNIAEEFFRIVVASSAGIMIIIIYIFLRQELFDSRFLVLGSWFFAIVFVFIGRLLVRNIQKVIVANYHFGAHKIMVIGSDEVALRLIAYIDNDPSSGYQITKHLSVLDFNEIRTAIHTQGLDELVLTHPNYSPDEIGEIIALSQEYQLILKFIPTISHLLISNFEMNVFKGLPFIEIKQTQLDGWGKVIKRAIDILGSFLGLIILFPVFTILALAVKWETEGPIFVNLRRISGTKEFYLLKFRSMIENAEELKPFLTAFNEREGGPLFKMRNDPRITKTGKLMRRARIDELPQLLNVLRGNMSLVGPRPHQPDEIARYQKHHKKVLAIKPSGTY